MNLDRRLLKLAGVVKLSLALAVLGGFLAGIFTVLQARQISTVIARVFLGGHGLDDVLPLLWGLLGLLVARPLAVFLSELAAGEAALRVKASLRDRLAEHLLRLGPDFTSGERSGELVNTAAQGVEQVDAYFSQYLPQLALAGLLPVAYLVIVFPHDPLSGVVLLLTGPLIPFFMFLIGANAQALTSNQWSALGRMSAYFLDTLQGLTTLKALGRSGEQAEKIAAVGEQYRETTVRVMRVTFLSALALELLSTMGTAIIAVQIGLRLLYGRIGFEEAFFLLLLAPEFYLPLRNLGLRFHAGMSGIAAAKRIFGILEVEAPNPELAVQAALPIQPLFVKLDGIRYDYSSDRSAPALEDFSLRLNPGEVTALVGPSGAGKSTLAHLLLRFIEPDRGSIHVNGVSLADLPIEDWRSLIAWAPQTPHLFHGTLTDNLRIASPDATTEQMQEALEWAGLSEFVAAQPLGLNTPVGEGGARISGGQAQRLALARVYLRTASSRPVPLLILDEPTAHLDPEQEQILAEKIRELCWDRTTLVIAHHLPTILNADRVIVLESGRVVESGAPQELIRAGGVFARLLDAYQEEGE